MPTTCRCCLMSTRGRCGYTLSIWSKCYEQAGIKTQPRNPTIPTAQGSDKEPPYLRLSRSPRQLPRKHRGGCTPAIGPRCPARYPLLRRLVPPVHTRAVPYIPFRRQPVIATDALIFRVSPSEILNTCCQITLLCQLAVEFCGLIAGNKLGVAPTDSRLRSEERRVGKGCVRGCWSVT